MSVSNESKKLPVAVAAIVGIALMRLLGFALPPPIPSDITLKSVMATILGIGVFCYFVTGVIAGAWANWKGYGYGALAAVLVFLGNLAYSLAIGTAYVDLSHPFWSLLGFFMAGLLALGIGALGGFVGDRIRSWRQQKK